MTPPLHNVDFTSIPPHRSSELRASLLQCRYWQIWPPGMTPGEAASTPHRTMWQILQFSQCIVNFYPVFHNQNSSKPRKNGKTMSSEMISNCARATTVCYEGKSQHPPTPVGVLERRISVFPTTLLKLLWWFAKQNVRPRATDTVPLPPTRTLISVEAAMRTPHRPAMLRPNPHRTQDTTHAQTGMFFL